MSTITYTVNSTPFLGENNQYHYFYKITNKVSGKFYYGIHSAKDLDDGYSGSGTVIKDCKKKYSIDKFHKEIIKFFETRKECSEEERRVVNKELLESENCYNLRGGGDNDYFHTEETKKKMGNCGKNNPNFGKPHSEEWKRKISESLKNHKVSEITREKLKKSSTGRVCSEETKSKMSFSHKGIPARNRKRIMCYETGRIYDSATEVGKVLGVSKGSVSHSALHFGLCCGYHWRYI